MKKIITKTIAFIGLILIVQGCYLKSVHPLFKAEDAILLDGMDGIYETEDQRWIFASEQRPDMMRVIFDKYPDEEYDAEKDTALLGINAYLVMYENKQAHNGYPTLFLGIVGEINGDHYLNLKILEVELGKGDSFVDSHVFNVNTFSKLTLNDKEMLMEPIASSWIKEQIMNNRVRIKHEVVESELDESTEILVTASTEELQQFIQKYGKDEKALEDPIRLKEVLNEGQ